VPNPSDADLLHRLEEGEKSAFGELYDRYYSRVYGYCFRLLGDRDRVEDIVQTVFLKALESVASLDRPELFYYWLFSIARNEVYAGFRKSRTNTTVQLTDEVWDTNTPQDIYAEQETAIHLEKALDHLKPEYREILILRHFERLSYVEIAAVTGDSLSAVESRLFKARKVLVKLLGPYMEERSKS
jgi:RNA polymerase sigma-70 factor (ECF subfamily)